MTAVRDDVHTGYAVYHVVSRSPFLARRSRLGVDVVGWPVNPRSPYLAQEEVAQYSMCACCGKWRCACMVSEQTSRSSECACCVRAACMVHVVLHGHADIIGCFHRMLPQIMQCHPMASEATCSG
jgi:hypothetical protein